MSSSKNKFIDFHVHPIVNELTSQDILKEMNKAHVKQAVLLAMDLDYQTLNDKQFHKELTKSLEYTHIIDVEPILRGMGEMLKRGNTPNDYVAEIVRTNRERFIGFGSVQIGHKSDKYVKNKLSEIKQFVDELNFRGIKLLPTLQFFSPIQNSGLKLVLKFAEKHNLMVMYHTGCDPGPWEVPLISKNGRPSLIEPFVRKFSTVKIILAHTGSYSSKHPGIWFNEAINLMNRYENVYGDISAVPFLTVERNYIEKLKKKSLINDKLLYGSDFPVTSGGALSGMQSTVEMLQNSQYLNEEEKNHILYLNAEKLLE